MPNSGRRRTTSSDEEWNDVDYERTRPSVSQRNGQSQVIQGSKKVHKPTFASQPSEFQLTDFEKEVIVDKVVRRIVSKYLISQRTFRKATMFLPEDKIKPKQQESLIPMINVKLKELTKLEMVNDGTKFIVSMPKELKANLGSQNRPNQSSGENIIVDGVNINNSCSSQSVQPPDDFTHILLTITLAVIYFYRGKIQEDELIQNRLPQILPFLTSCGDLTKTMQDFEQRAFIEKKLTKGDEKNPAKAYVYWGFRAKTEIDKKTLIPIFCKLGACSSKDLPSWLMESIQNNVDF